ncbi:hypothetical protein ACFV4N_20770 [Actinosynnema sp. NPDC059797]
MKARTRAALSAVGAVAALVSAAAPASAAPALTLHCASGQSMFSCSASPYTPNATITWQEFGAPAPHWDGQWSAYGWCGVGSYLTIGATVSDSTGSTSRTASFWCSDLPWP